MSAAKSDSPSSPSLADFVRDGLLRDAPEGTFVKIADDLLAATVNGRLRARAEAVLAGSGSLRITPASRFATFSAKAETPDCLAAVDGRGRVVLGEKGKRVTLLALRKDEALGVAPHAMLATEDSVSVSTVQVKLPLTKPVVWGGVLAQGPGRLAFVSFGEPQMLRVTPESPAFVRAGAVVAWSSGLALTGRAGASNDARIAFSGDGFVFIQAGL